MQASSYLSELAEGYWKAALKQSGTRTPALDTYHAIHDVKRALEAFRD